MGDSKKAESRIYLQYGLLTRYNNNDFAFDFFNRFVVSLELRQRSAFDVLMHLADLSADTGNTFWAAMLDQLIQAFLEAVRTFIKDKSMRQFREVT